MKNQKIRFLPSPLGVGHPANKGRLPIYVYDPRPAGGTYLKDPRAVAVSAFGASPSHMGGASGMAYGIPTSTRSGSPVPIGELKASIRDFCRHARADKRHAYQVNRIGGGRTGGVINERDIAETFLEHDPGNLHLPGSWERLRHPGRRRVCVLSTTPGLEDVDKEAVSWLLRDVMDVEIVVPGVPLQHGPAVEIAHALGCEARLLSAEAPAINGKPGRLMEALAWFCDFALIFKPRPEVSLSPEEKEHVARLNRFCRTVIEHKIGWRSLTAGVGIRPGGSP